MSIHNLLTLTLPHTTYSTPILHHLFSLSCFPHAIFTFLLLLVGRSWHVGLSGPLILERSGQRVFLKVCLAVRRGWKTMPLRVFFRRHGSEVPRRAKMSQENAHLDTSWYILIHLDIQTQNRRKQSAGVLTLISRMRGFEVFASTCSRHCGTVGRFSGRLFQFSGSSICMLMPAGTSATNRSHGRKWRGEDGPGWRDQKWRREGASPISWGFYAREKIRHVQKKREARNMRLFSRRQRGIRDHKSKTQETQRPGNSHHDIPRQRKLRLE